MIPVNILFIEPLKMKVWPHECRNIGFMEQVPKSTAFGSNDRSRRPGFFCIKVLLCRISCSISIFSKHSALESAIHKDLVKPGKWPVEMGQNFSWLVSTRSTGDYGGGIHVNVQDAKAAIEKARQIVEYVNLQYPDIFTL
jgi:hypothetical protein